ncbi:putative mitochondrial inner membrane signal peptidase putative serine peptidase clan SF family S26B [Leptomonas seymouri]|uniref:Mitochondrial inner membrane protease subunit n=1 Tax=Leptomonas seymouri TaxID=5684 RepID=A0A0N1I5U2_LEPSE|nr:putative mitochondrial inner membrane signal peptidase putative serine peptidase clan SF family S26B [Leptomonas seymouri]|eukprot:KPI88205.1 putative mitochondrial inner membrane signal peptidase putative serine peptidase clan SF family S26B [Leptomonas seymouri]
MALRQWWARVRASWYGDIPFILLGVFIGWNCDVSCAVKGVSMLPTLRPGEYILFIPYSLLQVRRWFNVALVKPGDVVVVKVSDDLSVCKRVTKRTAAKAEAEEWGRDHYVEVVPEPYFPHTSEGADKKLSEEAAAAQVVESERAYYDYVTRNAVRAKDWDACIDRVPNPSQWIWLEGDNKAESLDSRRCGPVPVECVRGLVLCSIWPMPHSVKRYSPTR